MKARVHKTRHDSQGERFAIVEVHERVPVVERVGSEFTIEEVFETLRERGVAEDETLAMLRSARIAFWGALTRASSAATVAGWTIH